LIDITHLRHDDWPIAADLACWRLASEQSRQRVNQLRQLVLGGLVTPENLWVARRGKDVCGLQLCAPLGGACFLFWLPVTEAGEPEVEDRLVAAALAWCRQQGGKVAQAILPPAEAGSAAVLLRHDFDHVTQLFYLTHDLHALPDEPLTGGVRFEPYSTRNEARFREALAGSYEDTLDCPEMNGVRSVDEVLAGYRGTDRFHPERWQLIVAGSEPAGVLILTELPDGPAWDLSYVGVLPEFRRRGLARAATRVALQMTRKAVALELRAAVDIRNVPALSLYRSLGFEQGETRDVHLHFFGRK
jgi:ribosomal protein S18 acetylase RimI-like enzyme